MVKKKRKILVICPFPQGVAAGQRLKYEQYFDDWTSNDYTITVSSFMDKGLWDIVYKEGNFFKKILGTFRGYIRRLRDVFRIRNYDIVYVFMWVTPVGTSFYERLYRFLAKKLIYDIEDNIFVEKANDLNPLVKLLKGSGKTGFLVKNANHIITSSPYLNDYCLERNKYQACTYISSSIALERYIPSERYNNEQKIVIGWTGTFTSKVFLEALRPVFKKLKTLRDFKLRVIGNFEYDFEEMDLEVIQWTKKDEIKDLQGIDIGVYPLPNEDWVLGKSGLKALQYMGMGIPTVSSKVGTAVRFTNEGENGFLAANDAEWLEAFIKLIDDPELRKEVGENGRETVRNQFSTEVIKKQYLEILNSL